MGYPIRGRQTVVRDDNYILVSRGSASSVWLGKKHFPMSGSPRLPGLLRSLHKLDLHSDQLFV